MSEEIDLKAPSRAGMLSLSIKERRALYAAFMPFVKGGGLFIPTSKPYRMGDQVYMVLTLMDDPTRLPISGKVVWLTPAGAQGRQTESLLPGVVARNGFADDSRCSHFTRWAWS